MHPLSVVVSTQQSSRERNMAVTASLSTARTTRNASSNHTSAITDKSHQADARQKEAAQYISDMILELRNMAKAHQLSQILVPLEYAYYEAFSAANKIEPPAEEVERLKALAKAADDQEAENQPY
jgi:hypothetical protein